VFRKELQVCNITDRISEYWNNLWKHVQKMEDTQVKTRVLN